MSTLNPTVQAVQRSIPQHPRPFKLIGELINSSFARAARANEWLISSPISRNGRCCCFFGAGNEADTGLNTTGFAIDIGNPLGWIR